MKEMRRLLSFLLVLVMVIGFVPANAFAAEVSADFSATTETVLDAAIFCSDVHGNSSKVSAAFNGIKNADSAFAPSTASFVGDTQMAASSVTSAAQSVYSGLECYYAYGNHDSEGNYGISDYTGLLYGDDDTNYYIYSISQTSMAKSNPDTSDFTDTVATLDKTKPLFILSHLPLHDRRGDSNGAAAWYPVIEEAAKTMDIVFFWGHNHTGEANADREAFYVAKNGTETITLENTSTVVTPNFTYMNAGYVGKSSSRGGVVTTVKIYADKLVFQDYTSSGAFTGTYSHNVTVTRDAVKTPTNLVVTGANEYSVGDVFAMPTVSVKYSDGTTQTLTADQYTVDGAPAVDGEGKLTTAGEYTLTYSCTLNGYAATAKFDITVEEVTTTGIRAVNNKETYNIGDELDITVYLTYSNGTEVEITDYTTSGFSSATTGTKTVWVEYGDYSTTLTVKVVEQSAEPVLTGLRVTYSKETLLGQNLVLKVTALYDDGTTDELESGEYTISGYDPTVTGVQGVVVTYGEQSYGFNVIKHETTEVTVLVDGASSVTVTDAREDVAEVFGDVLQEGFVAYDIVPNTYNTEKNVAVVKLPAPEGANAVYYWNKETNELEPVSDVTFADGYAVFTTDHFSIYVVGVAGSDGTVTEVTYVLDILDENGTVIDWVTSLEQVTSSTTLDLGVKLTRDDAAVTPTDVVFVRHETRTGGNFTPVKGILYWTVNDDKIVSSIDENGLVTFTGTKDGLVNISVYYCDQDATVWMYDSITVTVTGKDFYTDTSDKTNFPEYPEPGSVNINKTATAVGNFSQTGIAQVELYGNGVPTGADVDVVLMVDMTGSMTSSRVTAAVTAAQEFVEQIVYDETTKSYNNNRVAVYIFNKNKSTSDKYGNTFDAYYTAEIMALGKITDDDELAAAKTDISTYFKTTSGGTPYSGPLQKAQIILNDAAEEEGYDRMQFVVYMSDGEPKNITNGYKCTCGSSHSTADQAYSCVSKGNHEYYSNAMKTQETPITIFSISLLVSDEEHQAIINDIATDSTKAYAVEQVDGKDPSEAQITSQLSEAFGKIAGEIKQAATDVTIYDQITEEYELIFDFPSAMTEDGRENPIPDQEFYVEVVNYGLDSNYNRNGVDETLIRIYIDNTEADGDAKGAYYYKDGTKTFYTAYNSDTNPTGVTVIFNTDGSVGSIVCQYFTYNAATKSFTWTTDKLGDKNQIALRYFVYLSDSLEYLYDDDDSTNVPAAPYDTNTIAWIEYKNHQDHLCRQEFPVPQLTWNGAQVTYYFYLVNEDGKPINSAGEVISFTNAVQVTDSYTHSVVWNTATGEGVSELFVEYLAADILPAYYVLYDPDASYTIHVYEDETGTNLGNHFIIAGNKTINGDDDGVTTDKDYTTKVFMDKSSTKYDLPGTYTAANVFTGFDFADTTVAFAVMFAPSLQEDVVVVDFGLDVVVDVTANDKVDTIADNITLNGVSAEKYASVVMNNGVSYSSNFATEDPVAKKNLTISVENADNGTVRVKQTSMEFAEPVTFYYDAAVTFSNDTNGYMYSSITVIPATTVYYEDEFVDLKTYTRPNTSTTTYTENTGWACDGTPIDDVQHEDRPGVDGSYIYGYDAAYDSCSMYSMGSAAKISVNANQYGTAEFSFYGTGFDVIALTSNTTGTLIVQVYDENGTLKKTASVDTYYGYTCGIYEVTYTLNKDGKWEQTAIGDTELVKDGDKYYIVNADGSKTEYTGKVYDSKDEITSTTTDGKTAKGYIKVWKSVETDPNALYQVPVMKISGLEYGKYTAKISALYYSSLDHTGTENEDGSKDGYDLYLDAIRIYDPTGNQNDVANDAYVKDGEGYPEYIELRNQVIQDSGATVEKISMGRYQVTLPVNPETGEEIDQIGMMFIDSNPENTSISDYIKYGPNNELYLASGQAVTFNMDLSGYVNAEGQSIVADVQIGMKLANGANAAYAIYNTGDSSARFNEVSGVIKTATDMYYSIMEQAEGGTIVITNTGSGVLSITNIKITFTEKPAEPKTTKLLSIDSESATNAVNSLSYVMPSTANFDPEAMDITFNRTKAEVGNNVIVTVTTSSDVKDLLVNGKIATNKTTSYLTGETTWSFTVPVVDNGSLKVTVVGYDSNGEYTVPYSESVTVINQSGTAEDLLGKLFG